jgi:predicted DNA-binding protein (MmcQ/YjbR family)
MDIESLRAFCLSLPGTSEDVKWGADLCFLVGQKMFSVTGLEGEFSASMKVKDEEFEELCSRPGITPAPYMARNKWVLVTGGDSLSESEWKQYIRQSYELVKAKLPVGVRKKIDQG